MSSHKRLISKEVEARIRAALKKFGKGEEDIERYIQIVEGIRRDYEETDKDGF